jgi:hypothetical protein
MVDTFLPCLACYRLPSDMFRPIGEYKLMKNTCLSATWQQFSNGAQCIISGYKSFVTGYYLFVTGYYLLVTSYHSLVTSYYSLVTGYHLLVTGYYLLVTNYKRPLICFFL